MEKNELSKQTRFYRKIHKYIGAPLFIFMFLMGFTGLLLGWKKQTNLLPSTQKGRTENTTQWMKIDSLSTIAQNFCSDSLNLSADLDRIDIRPSKGIAKFVFSNHFTELQLDCQSGEILSISKRKSDIIEKIHDGSLIDHFLGIKYDFFKLFYTSIISLGLIVLSISGFFLWYNPKRIKGLKK
jgi:hypothetical protein